MNTLLDIARKSEHKPTLGHSMTHNDWLRYCGVEVVNKKHITLTSKQYMKYAALMKKSIFNYHVYDEMMKNIDAIKSRQSAKNVFNRSKEIWS